MATPFLFPGQEYCRVCEGCDGKQVEYAYCSESGRYFSCTASSEQAAREECEYFLLRKERN